MKILVATEKPFAPVAIRQIREVTEAAGFKLALLENYKNISELLAAVSDADAMIVRSDMVTAEVLDAAKQLKNCCPGRMQDMIISTLKHVLHIMLWQ